MPATLATFPLIMEDRNPFRLPKFSMRRYTDYPLLEPVLPKSVFEARSQALQHLVHQNLPKLKVDCIVLPSLILLIISAAAFGLSGSINYMVRLAIFLPPSLTAVIYFWTRKSQVSQKLLEFDVHLKHLLKDFNASDTSRHRVVWSTRRLDIQLYFLFCSTDQWYIDIRAAEDEDIEDLPVYCAEDPDGPPRYDVEITIPREESANVPVSPPPQAVDAAAVLPRRNGVPTQPHSLPPPPSYEIDELTRRR
ncbi:uncharacterized protein VTP21DRAFT_1461 [Calcarisporiella thermophila]|uniref:uncharacterized protein n=1 Tax=Calcarisporiella thermophila TaxID=911321 RepID=UPI003744B069